MTTTLIKNGTVVNATGTAAADVLVDGETIAAVLAPGLGPAGPRPRAQRRHGDRRGRQVRHPRRHRRAHPHGDAVRRHLRQRHLRDRHPGRGLGRHDEHRRLRRPVRRRARAGPVPPLAREGRGQLRRRLRLPPDPVRRRRRLAQGDGRADHRGRDQLQALHGLQGRLPVRRRPDPAGHAEGRRERLHDHDARRERRHDRRAGPAAASPRGRPIPTGTASPGPGRPRRRPRTGRS